MLPEILTDKQIDLIERLLRSSTMSLPAIAERFGVPLRAVVAIKAMLPKDWDRHPGKYFVGGRRMMSISEIAKASGCTRDTIHKRIVKGILGAELLLPKYRVQRRGKTGEIKQTKRKLVPNNSQYTEK